MEGNKKRKFNELQPNDLMAKFSSKRDLYIYLSEQVSAPSFCLITILQLQYHLAPESHLNKDFFKKLLMSEKKVFKIAEVRYILVPKLDEMAISQMLPLVQDDAELKKYFPDEYFGGKMPDRKFFFNTVNTLYPGFLEQLFSYANK